MSDIVAGGRCKEVLYLRRHRFTNEVGRGYRCKYCDISLIRVRNLERRKKKNG